MAIDESRRDALLDRLVEEFAARIRRGERPALREYTDRHPDLADEIRELFPAMVQVEQAKAICQEWEEAERSGTSAPAPPSQVGDYRIVREIGRGGMGVVYEAEQVSLGRRVALKMLPSRGARDGTTLARFRREARASARLHHTNIVPVFDVGQDGEILYYAMQLIRGQSLDAVIRELRKLRDRSRRDPSGTEPGRPGDVRTRVAIADAGVAHSLLTGRFRPDRAADADRDDSHGSGGPIPPGPVPRTAGETSAVMPGGAQLSSVESRCQAFHRGVAQIGHQVASALAYAHARGILHRDIKPSNLLLDSEGVAWVSDFGLAKVDDDELTGTGDILGTLRYMAPERFHGRGDARADVYSLGLTLYELLALRPAFDSPDRLALSEQVKTVEPPRPRSIDPRIPRDLETIVLKAIEKDPGDRYATAGAMAEDLRRYLDDEPILARRIGAPERYARWAKRNPVIAALGGVLTAVLLVATISSVLVARRMTALAEVNRDVARSERGARLEADRHRERAEQLLYTARIGRAEGALRLLDSATAGDLLDQCRPAPGGPDRRGWEWSYLDQWCHPEIKTIALPTDAQSWRLAASPDGRLLAVGCWDPDAVNARTFPPVPAFLIGVPDGRVRHELTGHSLLVHDLAFRPDGKRLATLGQEGTIRIWDTSSGRVLRTIRACDLAHSVKAEAAGLRWAADGRSLASATWDDRVRVWDPETGREIGRLTHNAERVAWGTDGSRFALGLAGGGAGLEVRRWDERAGWLEGPVSGVLGWVSGLCWSPDGRRLAAIWAVPDGGPNRLRLSLVDAASGAEVLQVVHPTVPRSIAISPDGTRVATGDEGGVVRVIDATDGRERSVLFTGAAQVSGLAFVPGGRRLYAAGWGMGGIKVFDPGRDPRGRRIPGWREQASALTFDREGLRILGVDWQTGGTLLRAGPDAGPARADRGPPVTIRGRWPRGDFAFSRDGRRLAAPTQRDGTLVGVWDVTIGRRVAELQGPGGPVTAVAFGPDGRSLASATAGGAEERSVVTLWHIGSSRPTRRFEAGTDVVTALDFSDDGRKLAAGGVAARTERGWATAWDTETGAVLDTTDRLGLVMSLAFHRDGRRIAIADFGEAQVHLWDLAAGTLITHSGPKGVSCVDFTPDGKRLAAIGPDGDVHLADARTGDAILVLRSFDPPAGGGGFTPRIAFSGDGARIAANSFHGALSVWDLGPTPALAVEPEADDVAGWLRRGRGLAAIGDLAGAEAALAHARDIRRDDASPWVEHALTLYRDGDPSGAGDALARAMGALPENPVPWIDLGRSLERLGRVEESRTVLARARSLCERRLARAPDDELAAAALAVLLLEADTSANWTVLVPDVMNSAAGTTLTRLHDGSVLASGRNPAVDTYTVEATTGLSGITGLRLEAIPDPSFAIGGSGRDRGNFHLDSIRLYIVTGRSPPIPVRLSRACADYSEPLYDPRGVNGAIDDDSTTAWSIWPIVDRPHLAVFQADPPIGPGAGRRLRVELVSRSKYPHSTLGRFRLSVTNRPSPLVEPRWWDIASDGERDGARRLGAAYCLRGDWAPAVEVLGRTAKRPDASALDEFLLALARHRLGRDDARSDCDAALSRLERAPVAPETRDVGIAALMTIRGLTAEEAESLLLDRVFPADPFGP